MPRPDEGLIHAWLDGELSPEEAARVERLVETDADWGAAAAEARGLVAASSRILRALDAVPGGVMPAGSQAAPRARLGFSVRPWMKVAAGLVLVVGTAVVVMPPSTRLEDSRATVAADAAPVAAPVAEPVAEPIAAAPAPASVPPPAANSPARAAPSISPAPQLKLENRASKVAAQGASIAQSPSVAAAEASGAAAPTTRDAEVARVAESTRNLSVDAERARAAENTRAIAADAERTRAVENARSRVADAERARSMDAAERSPAPQAMRAPAIAMRSAATGFSAKAISTRTLEGCWRTTTTAEADSLLVAPMIVQTVGDTMSIAVAKSAPARTARVWFHDEERQLVGTMPDAAGAMVTFRAQRIDCPSATPPPTPPR